MHLDELVKIHLHVDRWDDLGVAHQWAQIWRSLRAFFLGLKEVFDWTLKVDQVEVAEPVGPIQEV